MCFLFTSTSHEKNSTIKTLSDEFDKEKNKPFSLWKANSDISVSYVLRNKIKSTSDDNVIFNPFADLKDISYKGFIFKINRQKPVADGETTRLYYFRCGHPKRECQCNLKVIVNLQRCLYEFEESSAHEFVHLPGCKSVNLKGGSITRALAKLRTFAIELARNNRGKLSQQAMLAMVLLEMNLYNSKHDEPMPYLKSEKILNYFGQANIISKKDMIAETIPNDIWFLGEQWVLLDQEITAKKIMIQQEL